MLSFEILCVTMGQKDFSKIKEMNIRSNVVFANQADDTRFDEIKNDGYYAKMITTQTKGVGKNRNMALLYASADICLFADDDIVYYDNVKEKVVAEFEAHPDADIIIFHLNTDDRGRKQIKYSKTKKCGFLYRMPWATFRIAFRLSSIKKANLWFTTLFGGGCVFPSGEDSMWLKSARKKGLVFYKSKETIGTVSFEKSTWFTGFGERYLYAKGAFYYAMYKKMAYMWIVYTLFRTAGEGDLSLKDRFMWMRNGMKGYKDELCYEEYISKYGK